MLKCARVEFNPLFLRDISTGPRICHLPVGAAPKTREPPSRHQQLPRLLHAAPAAEAGGLAGAPCPHPHPHPHLQLRHGGFIQRVLFTAARQVRALLLRRQAAAQSATACQLPAAPWGETQGAGRAAQHRRLLGVQDQRPGDGGGRTARRIPGHRHHSGAAVPGGHVEHLQGQRSAAPVQTGRPLTRSLHFALKRCHREDRLHSTGL